MVRVLISVVERDAPAIGVCAGGGPALLDAFAAALEEAGLAVLDRHLATAADVADLGSSWAKRLGIPARRPACVLVAHKREEGCSRQSECQYWI